MHSSLIFTDLADMPLNFGSFQILANFSINDCHPYNFHSETAYSIFKPCAQGASGAIGGLGSSTNGWE